MVKMVLLDLQEAFDAELITDYFNETGGAWSFWVSDHMIFLIPIGQTPNG